MPQGRMCSRQQQAGRCQPRLVRCRTSETAVQSVTTPVKKIRRARAADAQAVADVYSQVGAAADMVEWVLTGKMGNLSVGERAEQHLAGVTQRTCS